MTQRPVVWMPEALDDLNRIVDYLAPDRPEYAHRLVDELAAEGNLLGAYRTGRPGRVHGTFEKSVPRLRYIIAYSLGAAPDGPVNILHVIHSAQNWQAGGWPG